MKFDCKGYKKFKAAKEWHDHFCWLPVQITPGDCRWLETVQNRFLVPSRADEAHQFNEFKHWRWLPCYNEWRVKP